MSAALEKNGVCLIKSVDIADTFRARMIGLMGSHPLDPGCALLITRCGSIHTFFMRFNLDLIFLDEEMKVVKLVRNVPPYRVVSGGMRARTTIEATAGWLPDDALRAGDRVTLSAADLYRSGASPTESQIS